MHKEVYKMCKNSSKVKTITFNKGSILSHSSATVLKYINLPGVDLLTPEVTQGIPDHLVIPSNTNIYDSYSLLIKYKGEDGCNTLNESEWFESETTVVEGVSMFVFNLIVRESTEFTSKNGNKYFFRVEYRMVLHTIPNSDPLTNTTGPYIIVKTPLPVIKHENVTYFSVNDAKKDIRSYRYNVATGNCKITYYKKTNN
jgi:hypothetical protein